MTTDLSLIPTDDLIVELRTRHELGVVLMLRRHGLADAPGPFEVVIRDWGDNNFSIIGLLRARLSAVEAKMAIYFAEP